MDVSDFTDDLWLQTATTMDIQQGDPIHLFGQFVSAVSSDVLKDIKPQLKLSVFVQDLCEKAPSVAQYLVQEILNHTGDDSQPEAQDPKERESDTNSKPKPLSKRRKQKDRTYQPPGSSKKELDVPGDEVEYPDISVGCRSLAGKGSVTCQPRHHDVNQSSNSLSTEKPQPLQKCEGGLSEIVEQASQEGVHGQSAAHGTSIGCDSSLLPLKVTQGSNQAKGNAVHSQPALVFDESTKDIQTTRSPPSLNEAEERETALSEFEEKLTDAQALLIPSLSHGKETLMPTSSDLIPSTPVRQIGRGSQSPLSDDQTVTPNTTLFTPTTNGDILSPLTDCTASPSRKIESLPEGVASSLSNTGQQPTGLNNTASTQAQHVNGEQPLSVQDHQTMLPLREGPTLINMVAKAVHLMYKMSRRQEVPTMIHSRILSTLQPSLGGSPTSTAVAERGDSIWNTSNSTSWSASMWINMLEAGQARSRESTILNMIEWMGASEWYDAELAQAEKAPSLTKQGKPRKRLATVVLDEYLKKARDTMAIGSPGNLVSEDNKGSPPSITLAKIQKQILDARRKKLINIFNRGRTIRKLIQMTHLGILFDPNIWSYAKTSKENIDKVAAQFQADPQKMELLSILDEQVELLVRTGRPDLSRFFDSLESHSITGPEEVLSLRAEYGLEREPVPQGCLDTNVDRVIEGIGRLLGKYTLGDEDSVMINGTVELSCGVFDRLRSREWLNCWDIAAALEMADRPMCVKLGLSIPLHKKSTNDDITPVSNPLRRWRKTIDDYRREGKNNSEGLVYFCPLNINANHFTLLEINEKTEMIYHYDSMASHKVIHHKTKSAPVRREIEEEFKYLNFGYTEAPAPQQKDGWSCGLMVIRNAKRRMIGLSVGSWDDEVDPDRVIKEVFKDCETFLDNDTLRPSPLLNKRKRIVEGIQNNVAEPSRSSKRLKQISEGSQ